MSRFTRLLTGTGGYSVKPRQKGITEREFLEMQAEQGRDIFGPSDRGCQREFFCLDENTWIWHEEWLDVKGKKQSRTTRYEIHSNGILKVQDGAQYQYLDERELKNFAMAVHIYYERVMKNVFRRDPITGVALQ